MRCLSLIAVVMIAGCTITKVSAPSNISNACSILEEKEDWYPALSQAESDWRIPPHVILAIIHTESSFVAFAKNKSSSAFGYAQALNGTWGDYIRETGNAGGSRSKFSDSVDFIGWYLNKNREVNSVHGWDAFNQYLAYHEGVSGYSRQTYATNTFLKRKAKQTLQRSFIYGEQLRLCEHQFKQD